MMQSQSGGVATTGAIKQESKHQLVSRRDIVDKVPKGSHDASLRACTLAQGQGQDHSC